ncbi:MAG TPA: hypothetical protein PKA28_12720 [Methylomusa anaerophila]|uniref:Uncharacterized protein n=1 Tax=Methylomusa anaerophila TaxID=1930071 RepID=A0A348AH11_9FIRM|nr:hypothetical protein [Methylomusa anaerophila]BBB90359.1 hypothetical protein MAMMFC1_01007 [Methylomusa anaerophila]HML89295.1 hypothetical protein [Methylomusa anaerophila]
MASTDELEITIIWLSIISSLLTLELHDRIKEEDRKDCTEKDNESNRVIKRLEDLEARVRHLEEKLAGR